MAERDYTEFCGAWELGGQDRERIINVVTNVIADHVAIVESEFVKEIDAFIHSHPETNEPSILIGFGEPGPPCVSIPISKAMYDADPELLAKVTALLEIYCNR